MRVLVCGGRTFNNPGLLRATLDRLHRERDFTTVIHGAARGADQLAGDWALSNGIAIEAYPITAAEWKKYGHAAGPMRNETMLRVGKPRLVVAFRGQSGTMHMVRIAEQAGLEIIRIGWNAEPANHGKPEIVGDDR